VVIATIEATKLNDFAYWRSLEARTADLLPGRPPAVAGPAVADAPVRSDNSVETTP
jgi:hypothetical protein